MGSPIIWGGNGAQNLQTGGIQLSSNQFLKNDGPKNYLVNPNLEINATTGWSLGNASVTSGIIVGLSPTFGSGASGNLTLSTVSSGALAGTYSLSNASSAATTVGDFIASDAFTIDTADQAKVLTFGFSYKASSNPANGNWSGTASNSFAVAIWNVTSSVWIIPAGVFNITQNSGVGYCTGSFQTTSTDTQYRLCIYNATASTGAITMLYDQFFLGPQTSPQGCPVSDWSSSPAIVAASAGFGTVTASVIKTRRVGDTLECRGSFTSGTVAASTASLALTGVTIDTAKIQTGSAVQKVGEWTQVVSAATSVITNAISGDIFFDGSTTGSVFFATAVGTAVFTKFNVSTVFSSTIPVSFRFQVPVTGWSSNVLMSNDTDTRVIEATYKTSAAQSITNATITIVNFDTSVNDTSGSVTTGASWKFTAPVTGYYAVNANILYATQSWSSGVVFDLYLYKNGAVYSRIFQFTISGTPSSTMPSGGAQVVQLNAGDYIDIRTNQSSAGAKALTAVASDNMVSVYRLSGPSVIAATETIAASYYCSANFAATTSVQINFDTKEIDTHNAVTPSATVWVFTAPASGIYEVGGNLLGSTTGKMLLYKNGSAYKSVGGASNAGNQALSAILRLVAGDTISVRPDQNITFTGGTLATAGTSNISIKRIGL